MTEDTVGNSWRRTHLFFVVTCLVILAVNLVPRINGFYIIDDAFMFVRYADHFLESGIFSWDGQTPAYGATSLLYVITLLPFRLLAPDNPALALYLSSFFWGLAFVAAALRLVGWELKYPPRFRPMLTGLVWLVLASTAKSLVQHFTSGMDTTLALFTGTLFLILLKRLERDPKFITALWVGLVGGLAWWVRPDLMAFTLGIPAIAGLASTGSIRRGYWLAFGITLGVWGLLLLAGKGLAGHWLPHSFLAKSTGIYGPEFKQVYRWLPLMEFSRFVSRTWPLLLLIGFSLWLNRQVRKANYSALEKGILVAAIVFALYHLFFVIPIMGFGQRFWFPLLPFLLLVAARILLNLRDHFSIFVGADIRKVWPRSDQWAIAVLGVVLLYYGITGSMQLRKSKFDQEWGVFNTRLTYQQKLHDYWFRLDCISDLPNDLVIATTEVGIPAALNPHKRIVDIAALNEPALVGNYGPDAEDILSLFHPDVIYLPHSHYARLNRSFASSKSFKQDYTLLSEKESQTAFAIAFRKSSPYFGQLVTISNQRGFCNLIDQ